MASKDLWLELQALLQERRAPTEWIKVPSHTGLHGNEMADELADLGVRGHGVRMQGQERPTRKRQADWARDRGNQEQGSQGHAPPIAAPDGAPPAAPQRPHAGGGVQRLVYITYVDIEEQRRDEGLRYAVYLEYRTEALALRTAEVGQQRPLLARCIMCNARGYSGSGTMAVRAC